MRGAKIIQVFISCKLFLKKFLIFFFQLFALNIFMNYRVLRLAKVIQVFISCKLFFEKIENFQRLFYSQYPYELLLYCGCKSRIFFLFHKPFSVYFLSFFCFIFYYIGFLWFMKYIFLSSNSSWRQFIIHLKENLHCQLIDLDQN